MIRNEWRRPPEHFGNLVVQLGQRLADYPGLVETDVGWRRNAAGHGHWEYDDALDLPDTLPRAELSPEDLVKVDKMKGIALIGRGEYEEAVEVFESIADRAQLDDASTIYFARALEACGQTGDAIAYLRAGLIREGLRVYEDKLCRPGCQTRQYLVEHARILQAVGGAANLAEMREVCTEVLDSEGFGDSPLTAQDFYYVGFANYLLGNYELARYDYERSRGLFKYYDEFA